MRRVPGPNIRTEKIPRKVGSGAKIVTMIDQTRVAFRDKRALET